MGATGTMTGRQWAQALGLWLAVAAAVVTVVAVVLPTAALAITLALLVAGAAMVARRVTTVARAARAAVGGAAAASNEAPRPTLRLELASGEVINARPVSMNPASGHTLALTRDGYVVLGAEGKVLHRL